MKVITLSEEKLNELAQEASERMMKGRYLNQGTIRGEELKSFSEHNQINKFLLFQVYQVWNMQLSKLKHPYFDFDNSEIQDILNTLRNQLSRNISISTEDFGTMLQRAVYNNLKLLTAPKEAFSSFFFVNTDKTSIELFERYTPFFADLDFIVNSILHFHKKNGLDSVEKETFFAKMDRVIELYDSKSAESFDAYCASRIQQLTGKTTDELLRISEVDAARTAAETQEKAEAEKRVAAAVEAEEAAQKAAELKKEEVAAARVKAEQERLKQEEEARKKAEAEAKRATEEARKSAEALREKEQELKRLEAERLRAEEEKKKLSFFDTISGAGNYFDIDDEDSAPVEKEAEVEEVVLNHVEAAPVVESAPIAPVEEVVEEVVEEEALIEPEIIEEPPVAEVIATPTEILETPEVVEAVVDQPDTIAEQLSENLNEEKTVFERLKAQADAKEQIPSIAEAHESPVEEAPEETDKSKESTASFLDRFLNNKKEEPVTELANTPEPEPEPEPTPEPKVESKPVPESKTEDSPTVIDEQEDEERPQTIAEKFTEQAPPSSVHTHTLNGSSGKIKLDEIPIHKQYQYVQKVFDGNNVRFRIIVDKVNNAKGKEEVEDILNKFVLNNDSLDRGDGVVKEFLVLLRKRF